MSPAESGSIIGLTSGPIQIGIKVYKHLCDVLFVCDGIAIGVCHLGDVQLLPSRLYSADEPEICKCVQYYNRLPRKWFAE